MKQLGLALLVVSAWACGSEPATAISAKARIDAALSDDVKSLSLYIFGINLSDGIQVTCSQLAMGELLPTDPRLDTVAHDTFDLATGTSFMFEDVPASQGYRIYGDAKNASGTAIANACTPNVEVASGETTEVVLRFYAF